MLMTQVSNEIVGRFELPQFPGLVVALDLGDEAQEPWRGSKTKVSYLYTWSTMPYFLASSAVMK